VARQVQFRGQEPRQLSHEARVGQLVQPAGDDNAFRNPTTTESCTERRHALAIPSGDDDE
jgi:hypothetical protein